MKFRFAFFALMPLWLALPAEAATVEMTLFPERTPAPGQSVRVVVQLTLDGKPLTVDDIKTVHTQKFHLLVIDPTLTDYQHIHPTPTATPGSYLFTFSPKFKGGYRAWADVTPMATGEQQLAAADLGSPGEPKINKKPIDHAIVGKYRFGLSFDEAPTAGDETMGGITVTDSNGRKVTRLEPVMGAFAHIVGFYEDYQTVVHTHPMGEEPKGDADRGGPTLMFHLAPEQAGFIRLFAQMKIDGKDIFVPFGVKVAEEPEEEPEANN